MIGFASNDSGCFGDIDCYGAQQIAVTVSDGLIFITGVVSQAVVVRILLQRQQYQRRHGTTILLLNLSAADALQLVCLPFNVAAINMRVWVFGDFLCRLVSFAGIACSCTSVFTLAALAINRYINILHPSKAFRFHRNWYLAMVLICIWLPSLGLATPEFVYRKVEQNMPYCFAFLTDDSETAYCASLFLCAFVVPLATITAMYTKILSYLRAQRHDLQTSSLDRYNTQITTVSVLLVVAFTVCWLPSYVLMFLLIQRQTGLHGAFSAIAWVLSSSSTIINPIIYLLTSQQFRKDLWALLARRCWGKWHNKVGPANLNIQLPATQQSQVLSIEV